MTLWIDGDACPRAAREIVFRAAERVGIEAVLVANRDLAVPRSRFVRAVRVPKGFDVADHFILARVHSGDIVVTSDVPLAAALVARGARVVSHRGDAFTEDNVADRLATRDLLQGLRDLGAVTGGPPPFGASDRRRLANALDRLLSRVSDTGV